MADILVDRGPGVGSAQGTWPGNAPSDVWFVIKDQLIRKQAGERESNQRESKKMGKNHKSLFAFSKHQMQGRARKMGDKGTYLWPEFENGVASLESGLLCCVKRTGFPSQSLGGD